MGACAPDSPSLLPEAPVASTPGPRATALQKVFAAALSASLKTNSYGNFSSCFPTPASYCSGALEGVWSQVNSRLEQQCNREFEQILVDRQVVAGLNAWEDLIDEARKRSQRAVDGEVPERSLHTLTAEELYAAHLHPYLSKATNELDIRVQKSQQENAVLLARIKDQRLEMERLLSGLEHAVADVEGSVNVMHTNQQPRLDELRGEVWQMDQEVAASRLVSGS